jgi:RecB family exonuclease
VHRILERLALEHGQDFCAHRNDLQHWLGIADGIASEEFEALTATHALRGEGVRKSERARMKRDVEAFVRQAWSAQPPVEFVAIEREFGAPDHGLSLDFEGESLFVHGYIDRVDVQGDRLVVRDYKTGGPKARHGALSAPTPESDAQIALYVEVAREAGAKWTARRTTGVGGAYLYPSAWAPERAFIDDAQALSQAAARWFSVAARLLAARMFPRTVKKDACTYCPFKPACGPNAAERTRGLLEGVDGPAGMYAKLMLEGAAS